MTELSFLLELLLEHKLPKPTRIAITDRIKEIDTIRVSPPVPYTQRPPRTAQSPSTQRILDEMAAEQGGTVVQEVGIIGESQLMPAVIAQTPAAVAALNARNEAIRIAVSGKEEKGRTSPRKF